MDREDECPLSEPLIVPTLFISGADIDANGDLTRITGWEITQVGDARERRVVVRIAMSVDIARRLHARLGETLVRIAPECDQSD
jgi:hypothetical protein